MKKKCNIFNFPLYYISFKKNEILEKELSKYGFTDINHFKAIDGTKFKPYELKENGFLTSRSYNDLINGRSQHSGLPKLGAVGCTLSHSTLWRKCVEEKIPFITIVEEDVLFKEKIDEKLCKLILDSVNKKNGIFVGTNLEKNKKNTSFIGLQFYVVSNGACKELVKNVFPIDVQTDFYMADLDFFKKVDITGYPISTQKYHKSSIQLRCIQCDLPKSPFWYILLLVFLMVLLIGVIIYYRKYKQCKLNSKIM
jgi:GR25 family glycosyltransferase involved in LPS biosynthesis